MIRPAIVPLILAFTRAGCLGAPAPGGDDVARAPVADPAPPIVHRLDPPERAAPSLATDYPELTTYRAPGPLAPTAVTTDWPSFLGPERSGHSAETDLARTWPDAGPPLVWTMTRGQGYACPVVQGGRLVFTHRVGGDQFFGVVASPLVFGDVLIQNIGAPGGPCVAAFDVATGRLVWGAGATWGPGCASPVVADAAGRARLFVLTGGDSRPPTGGLMVLDPATGSIDFEYPFRSRTYESVNGASPVVGDGRVFITAAYGTGTAGLEVAPDGGFREAWKNRRIGMQFSNPLYVKGHVYAIDGRSDRVGAVVCLDPASGEELSRTDLAWDETVFYRDEDRTVPMSIGEGSMLFVDGRALCLGDNGHLLWLDLAPTGVTVRARASLFRANESWTPPALSRGLLYVCQNNRERFGREPAPPRLLCFDLRGE